MNVTGITQVNSVDIKAAEEQQDDENASSGEQIYTIVHTTLHHSNTTTWIWFTGKLVGYDALQKVSGS
jgi:hypothetical protein